MKKIVVPVDFSEESVNAFHFALDVASESGANILLLHIIALPVLHDPVVMSAETLRKPLVDELKEIANKRLLRMTGEFNSDGVDVRVEVIISSRIHPTIVERLKKEDADLVVMGTKGSSGVREWMIGSKIEKVVRNSPIPVISVKQYVPGKSIRNIVFPHSLDFENEEALIMKVKALQDLFHARLHIIWVNTPALFRPESEARRQLLEFAERFTLNDFTINVFNHVNEEAGILEFTKQINGDLIAMGTHGLNGFAHLICGSIAEDVVNHVDCLVWTYSTRSVTSEIGK